MSYMKGPWIVSHKEVLTVCTAGGGSFRTIATVGAKKPTAMDVANARLIACAPELLEALEACIPDLQHYAATHGPGPDNRFTRALAACLQANGVEPK